MLKAHRYSYKLQSATSGGERINIMALALTKFEFQVNFIGARDAQRSKTFEILASGVDDATKRTNAQTASSAILTAFEAVSDVFVQSTRLAEVQYDADPVPASGLGNVYNEVIVTAGLDVGGGKKASLRIPAPADGIFVGDSGNTDDVDTSDSALLAFVNEFINDGSALGALSDGEQLESPANIYSARLTSVRSGKTY